MGGGKWEEQICSWIDDGWMIGWVEKWVEDGFDCVICWYKMLDLTSRLSSFL